ncbi:MAG TPA: efflux RND transporter periplasmic adaptor subunit [Candidatus Acidoferrales bacterium]|nr:efflux RND transporter periplasmic adaptor subunit [Candidatus Acidoferrales bacterium]
MIRKLFVGILIVLVILAGLAAVKFLQIRTMLGSAALFAPPPETIATALVREETWPDTLTAVGSVSPAQGVMVSPEIAGTVNEIAFESGATVKQGDLLLRLDTSSEEAQLRAAEAQSEWAKVTVDREKKLQSDKTVSQSEVDQADATWKQAVANADNIRATIQKKTIRAPFAGKLGIRLVNLGEQLDVGKSIVSLQSLSPVFVDFSLPQQEIAKLQTGLKVRAAADAYPTNQFEGEITAINPDLDTVTRSVRVRARFENTDELLRAGMFARVTVLLPQRQTVKVIPATAILSAPYGDSVFIVTRGPGGSTNLVVHQAFVRTGRARGDFVSVESGLKVGDRVATAGVFKLRNGAAVRENNDLSPEASETPSPPNS